MPATFIAKGVKMGVSDTGTPTATASQLPTLGAGQ